MPSGSDISSFLHKLKILRVVVSWAPRGFGHQVAARTLMQRLRELGFHGKFDVVYVEDRVRPEDPISLTSRLAALFKSEDSELGEFTITQLPELQTLEEPRKGYPLEQVFLCMSAADDHADKYIHIYPSMYHCDHFIALQPTNWLGGRHLMIQQGGEIVHLNEHVRLGGAPSFPSRPWSPLETEVLSYCDGRSQLIYGLYETPTYSFDSYRNLELRFKLLLQAHLNLPGIDSQPTVLFVPQSIIHKLLEKPSIKVLRGEGRVALLDLTKPGGRELKNQPQVLILHTGVLAPDFFNHLIKKTNLPAVVEGSNARALCEAIGKPYIPLLGDMDFLVWSSEESDKNPLQMRAAKCLSREQEDLVPALTAYMVASHNGSLQDYHEARRDKFLKRPEAIKNALNTGFKIYPSWQALAAREVAPIASPTRSAAAIGVAGLSTVILNPEFIVTGVLLNVIYLMLRKMLGRTQEPVVPKPVPQPAAQLPYQTATTELGVRRSPRLRKSAGLSLR